MTAIIVPLRRRTQIALSAGVKTEAAELAAIRANLELQREELLDLIEGLQVSPAAGMSGDLGAATKSLSSAAYFTLVQVELMLRQARALSAAE